MFVGEKNRKKLVVKSYKGKTKKMTVLTFLIPSSEVVLGFFSYIHHYVKDIFV